MYGLKHTAKRAPHGRRVVKTPRRTPYSKKTRVSMVNTSFFSRGSVSYPKNKYLE